MRGDTKLGLALGVLLVGVVGAMFFRNEADPTAMPPQLQTARELDAQIAQKAITPYLTGIEPEAKAPAQLTQDVWSASPADWEIPDFLTEDAMRENEQRLAGVTLGPPDPIPAGSPATGAPIRAPIQPQPAPWQPLQRSAPRDVAAVPAYQTPITRSVTQTQILPPPTRIEEQPIAGADGSMWHIVRDGETLSGIATRYLGNSHRFEEIYEANRDQMRSPHDVRAGMKIRIPNGAGGFDAPRSHGIPAQSIATDHGPAVLQGIETSPPEVMPQATTATPAPTHAPSRAIEPVETPAPEEAAPTRRFVPARRSPLAPWRLNGRASAHEDYHGPRKRLSQAPPEDLPPIRPMFDFGLLDDEERAAASDTPAVLQLPLSASSETEVDAAKSALH